MGGFLLLGQCGWILNCDVNWNCLSLHNCWRLINIASSSHITSPCTTLLGHSRSSLIEIKLSISTLEFYFEFYKWKQIIYVVSFIWTQPSIVPWIMAQTALLPNSFFFQLTTAVITISSWRLLIRSSDPLQPWSPTKFHLWWWFNAEVLVTFHKSLSRYRLQ